MAKKLKSFASFGNKRYDRGSKYFSTKAEIIKEANKQKKMGKNVVRDKNSKGHFLWINAGTAKPKAKKSEIDLLKKSRERDARVLGMLGVSSRSAGARALAENRERLIKPKAKPKAKWKVDKDKISDLKFSIKRLEKSRDEKVAEYSAKIKATDDTNRKKQLRKSLSKTRRSFTNDIEKVNNKIIREKLHYAKIRNLVKKTFPDQKSESHSTSTRGFRRTSSGYNVEIPTVYNPQIKISWDTGIYANSEKQKEVNKNFMDKLKPVLKEHNIKFTERFGTITIEKER